MSDDDEAPPETEVERRQLFAGRYQLDVPLGRGGMGEVVRAWDTKLRRAVAIKMLIQASGEAAHRRRARLLREARAVAALNHPSVVAVYDVGEADGRDFIVMELLEGGSVAARLAAGPIERELAIEWLLQIAEALASAHEAGFVHRDIKPANLLIDGSNRVKVADFGIVKEVDRTGAPPVEIAASTVGAGTLTVPGTMVGTPLYMAPEQLRGEAVDGRADQYAWGIVAYQLLAGAHPYRIGREVTAEEVANQRFVPARVASITSAGPAIERLVFRALAPAVDARTPTMTEVAEAIRSTRHTPQRTLALNAVRPPAASAPAVPTTVALPAPAAVPAPPPPIPAAPATAPVRPSPWAKVVVALAVVCIALVAGIGLMVLRRGREPALAGGGGATGQVATGPVDGGGTADDEAGPAAEARWLRSFQKAFNDHDVAALGRLYASDAVFMALGSDGSSEKTLAAVLDGYRAHFQAFPDARMAITRSFHMAGVVVVEFVQGGVMAATRRRYGYAGATLLWFDRHGKPARDQTYFDAMTADVQLEVAKPPYSLLPVRPVRDVPTPSDRWEQHVGDASASAADDAKMMGVRDTLYAHALTPNSERGLFEMLSEDVVFSELDDPKDAFGRAGVAAAFKEWHGTFSNMRMDATHTWRCGEFVIFEGTFSGKHTGPWGPVKPTGREFTSHFLDVTRIDKDRKVDRMWTYASTSEILGLARQGK